jgi:hypothetical protein
MTDNKDNADTTANNANGGYSDSLVKLVEETDKDGAISYCVECAKTGDLLYSSNSKPQAYSFCEGYRARDTNGDDTPKPKLGASKTTGGNDDTPTAPAQTVDPAKVQRKRMLI